MLAGTLVYSLDLRDNREQVYEVIESDIQHSSGLCDMIALPGEERGVYRLQRLLVEAREGRPA